MDMGQKVVVNGDTATLEAATLTDIVTTVISPNTVLTGIAGLGQKVGIALAAAAIQNKRAVGSFNIFQ